VKYCWAIWLAGIFFAEVERSRLSGVRKLHICVRWHYITGILHFKTRVGIMRRLLNLRLVLRWLTAGVLQHFGTRRPMARPGEMVGDV